MYTRGMWGECVQGEYRVSVTLVPKPYFYIKVMGAKNRNYFGNHSVYSSFPALAFPHLVCVAPVDFHCAPFRNTQSIYK